MEASKLSNADVVSGFAGYVCIYICFAEHVSDLAGWVSSSLNKLVLIFVHIYVYMYKKIEREKERERQIYF